MKKFSTDQSGNIAVLGALMMPILIGLAGAGLDYSRYYNAKSDLQAIADMAAIAGAREYVVVADGIPVATAQNIADKSLAKTPSGDGASATVSGDEINTTVTVKISRTYTPTLLVGLYKNPLNLEVDATAQALGGANICVIVLEEKANYVLEMTQNATLTGQDCAVYSNSTGSFGIGAYGNSTLKTSLNCTAGGYDGAAARFDPKPLTDCPPREDPLFDRPTPSSGSCSLLPNLIKDLTIVLTPAVYCGGLMIDGNADVTLLPGKYVIRDGDLEILANARVVGNGVGFYFEGTNSTLTVGPDATLSMTAMTDGDMAGLLMFQDRNAKPNTAFTISSNNAETLVGTIYLPQARLFIDAQSPVASQSAYTAIIARRLELTSSVNLVLNSDYKATDVPVPAGLAGAGGNVILRD
ncbi:MAG: pilus assembly protein [Marinicaulis sp.]|nr:pilus assembly protein [Marinicaulis sp.]